MYCHRAGYYALFELPTSLGIIAKAALMYLAASGSALRLEQI
jgi:hypothetical protein